jgi:ribosomal protein S18 acetylase RimI-like enzyme
MSAAGLRVVPADLDDAAHADALRDLVDAYARDPMGGGEPLADEVLARLVPALRAHPTTHAWLAFDGERPVGLALCFLGFASFEARPLLNVHDLVVAPGQRRRGVGRALLAAVEAGARALGCCRVTLEVRQDNAPARALYADVGFRGYALGGEERPMFFLTRELDA